MSTKRALGKLIEQIKTKQFRDGEAKGLMDRTGEELKKQFGPALEGMGKELQAAVAESLKGLKMPEMPAMPEHKMPEIPAPIVNVPEFNIPTPQVHVRVPDVHVPAISVPAAVVNFPSAFKALLDYDRKNPMPVMMVDPKGQPFYSFGGGDSGPKVIRDIIDVFGISLIDSSTPSQPALRITGSLASTPAATFYASDAVGSVNVIQSITLDVKQVSGSSDSVVVTEIFGTTGTNAFNPDNRLKVELPSGASGLTDTELRASAVPVAQVSGVSWSTSASIVAINDIFSTTATSTVVNSDNRVRVELPAGSSGLTDTELRATAVPVAQVSGASWSTAVVSVSDIFSTTATSNVVNPDNRIKVELPATSVTVSSITASTATVNLDRDGNPQAAWQVYPLATGLNETNSNVLRVAQMTDVTTSVNVVSPVNQGDAATAIRVIVAGNSDTSTVVNSGTLTAITNTLTVNQLSGANWSVAVSGITGTTSVVGDIASDVADTESNPVKIGGIARTANPAAVAAGDRVAFSADDLGRQIVRPYQVRDLTLTAYVSIANGTETTLLAASAASLHDLIMITATNNSSAATQLDIRCTTAGNIVNTLYIPAQSTAGWVPALPWPQDATGNNWTIDMPDQTGTTVYVSGLFVREV